MTSSSVLLPLQVLRETLQAMRLEFHSTEPDRAITLQSGLRLEPYLVSSGRTPQGQTLTTTVVEVSHASCFSGTLFEYQHANDDTEINALRQGFDAWARMDLLTLIDACQYTPQHCSTLELNYGTGADGNPCQRQVLLGPMAHFQQSTPLAAEEHAFCPCCLFINGINAFEPLLRSDAFFGIRLYASRDADGECNADCRVNGHDFSAGVAPLLLYADHWPEAGAEFRKQYVVIRNKPPLLA